MIEAPTYIEAQGTTDVERVEGLSWEDAPMKNILRPEERLHLLNNRDSTVAVHELGHGFAALAKGFSVPFLTINPGDDYEGITYIRGFGNNYSDFSVVAAAGVIAAGTMEGGGSDMSKILPDDHSRAMSAARSIIESITKEEWEQMAKIMTVKRSITGAELPVLLAQARFELKMPELDEYGRFVRYAQEVEDKAEQEEWPIIDVQETQMRELENGISVIYTVRNGKVEQNSIDFRCNKCSTMNGHTNDCVNKEITSIDQSSLPRTQYLG